MIGKHFKEANSKINNDTHRLLSNEHYSKLDPKRIRFGKELREKYKAGNYRIEKSPRNSERNSKNYLKKLNAFFNPWQIHNINDELTSTCLNIGPLFEVIDTHYG